MNSKIFTIGFLSGVISFAALNIYSYSQVVDPMCGLLVEFGMPFTLGTYGGFVTTTHILWSGVIANMCVALIASYMLGWAIDKLFMSQHKLP
jgi:hypothetical protein